jgi:CheY-like chemotaxis protein
VTAPGILDSLQSIREKALFIQNINWGYDGDCGAKRHAEEIETLAEEAAKTLAARPSTQPASTGAALLATILLVSNEDYIRELIGAILSVEGYKVLQADGAQSALDQAEFGSKIDLILVDAYLPGMPMLELVNRIRAFNQQAALLCMSGGGTLDASRDLDPSECIQKPFTPRRMVERIAAALKAATGGENGT